MECHNCNRTYNDEFTFCPYCGEKKPEPKICPKCKFKSIGYSYCPYCGKKLIPIQYLRNKKHEKKNNLRDNVQKSSAKSYKIKLYDYLNSLDNVKNRIVIERRIEAGEITKIEEIDNIRIPKPRKIRTITTSKKPDKKQELYLYLNKTNIGTNAKRKIRKSIEAGEITKKSQIDSYARKKGESIGFESDPYRDGYEEDWNYMKDLYG